MKRKIRKSSALLIRIIIFLCLAFVAVNVTSTMYARYISQSDTSDSADVAIFIIDTDLDHVKLGSPETPTLELGGTEEITSVQLPFYISSESEVKVGYSVKLDFGYALPEYLNITLTNGTDSKTISADGINNEFEFVDFGTLLPAAMGEQKADLVLTFSVSDLSMITDEISIPTAKVTVRAYQVGGAS